MKKSIYPVAAAALPLLASEPLTADPPVLGECLDSRMNSAGLGILPGGGLLKL